MFFNIPTSVVSTLTHRQHVQCSTCQRYQHVNFQRFNCPYEMQIWSSTLTMLNCWNVDNWNVGNVKQLQSWKLKMLKMLEAWKLKGRPVEKLQPDNGGMFNSWNIETNELLNLSGVVYALSLHVYIYIYIYTYMNALTSLSLSLYIYEYMQRISIPTAADTPSTGSVFGSSENKRIAPA